MRKPLPPDLHRQRPLEPEEHGQFRDMRDEWVFRRWFKTLLGRTLTWTTAVLVLIGLFRERIVEVFDWLSKIGAPPPQ